MATETLHDYARPMLACLSLFGVMWKGERRWGRRKLKVVALVVATLVFLMLDVSVLKQRKSKSKSVEYARMVLFSNSFTLLFCLFKSKELSVLVAQLKALSMTNAKIKDRFRRIKCLLVVVLTTHFLCMIHPPIRDIVLMSSSVPALPAAASPAKMVAMVVAGVVLFLVSASLIGVILMLTPCITVVFSLVIYYVKLTFDDALEELKRCKSPLRRDKKISLLFQRYYRLHRLARQTDRLAAPIVFALKSVACYAFLWTVFGFFRKIVFKKNFLLHLSSITPSIQYLHFPIVYLMYIRVAPSVNRMPWRMANALVRSMQDDDQWWSCDPALRLLLLQMRLNQLIRVVHVALDGPPLTMLAEPIDEGLIFNVKQA